MINFADFYWFIGADTANVWSSKRARLVSVEDAEYVAWYASHSPSRMDDMQQLFDKLAEFYPPGSLETYCTYTRWRLESGGMTLTSGMQLATDDRGKARVNGVVIAATGNPQFTTQWHATDNTIHPLDKAAIDAMSTELQAFIENAFRISADVLAQIEAGSITSRDQIDAAFGIPPDHYVGRRKPWDV